MILLDRPLSPTLAGHFAVDTETTLIAPRRRPVVGKRASTTLDPFVVPDLIIGSVAGDGASLVLDPSSLHAFLLDKLSSSAHLVFHNIAFDVPVLLKAFPDLRDPFFRAADAGRLHDTMLLEVLLQMASGSGAIDKTLFKSYHSLSDLALRRTGLRLNKDDNIRCAFGQFVGRVDALQDPAHRGYLEYALQDAVATLLVYQAQTRLADFAARSCDAPYPIHPNAASQFGLLGEAIEVRAAIGFALFEQGGVPVDVPAAMALRQDLEAELEAQEALLIPHKLARRAPRSGRLSLSHKAIAASLAALATAHDLIKPYTPTGALSLAADDWSDAIEEFGDAGLKAWLALCKTRKTLTTYAIPYSLGPRHFPTYAVLGARTGRTSCRSPNIQNIPKRKRSIRSIFKAPPGHVVIEADFKAAELIALAEVFRAAYGGSSLERDLRSGEDVHVATAKRLFPDRVPTPADRQAAKAVNFGLPGGLGVIKLRVYARKSFGLDLTETEIRALKQRALSASPELRRYLSGDHVSFLARAASNLNLTLDGLLDALDARLRNGDPNLGAAYRALRDWSAGGACPPGLAPPPGFSPTFDLVRSSSRALTGHIRGRCSYTEAHNLPFQSLIASAGKLAVWYLMAVASPPTFVPFAFVHDSIAVVCLAEDAADTAAYLKLAMERGLRDVCPALADGSFDVVEVLEPGSSWK